MRQVSAMLKVIDSRLHNEMAIEASFHGIKIPVKSSGEPAQPVEITEAEASAMNKARMRAQSRKAEEFSRRYG